MTTTAECGWDHDGIDLRLVLDQEGDILDIIEEGTEIHRPDLLSVAVAAIPGMRTRIDRALSPMEPDDYDGRYDTREEYEGLR